nr:hypothetical protein Itr_chr05CG14670 [Ipomoea trifida]
MPLCEDRREEERRRHCCLRRRTEDDARHRPTSLVHVDRDATSELYPRRCLTRQEGGEHPSLPLELFAGGRRLKSIIVSSSRGRLTAGAMPLLRSLLL